MKSVIRRDLSKVMKFTTGSEVIYQFDLRLFFQALENPGWFENHEKDSFYTKDSKDGKNKKGDIKSRKGERKAKTRYKRIDVDNRVKFLQDCVATLIGLYDDSNIFKGSQEKHEDQSNPRSEVVVTVIDREYFFQKGGAQHA